jgi:hypothetical protein
LNANKKIEVAGNLVRIGKSDEDLELESIRAKGTPTNKDVIRYIDLMLKRVNKND